MAQQRPCCDRVACPAAPRTSNAGRISGLCIVFFYIYIGRCGECMLSSESASASVYVRYHPKLSQLGSSPRSTSSWSLVAHHAHSASSRSFLPPRETPCWHRYRQCLPSHCSWRGCSPIQWRGRGTATSRSVLVPCCLQDLPGVGQVHRPDTPHRARNAVVGSIRQGGLSRWASHRWQ